MKNLIISIMVVLSLCVLLFLCAGWLTGHGRQPGEGGAEFADNWESMEPDLQDTEEVQEEIRSEEFQEELPEAASGPEEAFDGESGYGVERKPHYLTGYAYDTLPMDEKRVYAEILEGLTGHEEEKVVSTLEEKTLSRIFQCVMNDHPEIFYVDGYTYTKYKTGDEITKITFHGDYLYEEEEIAERQERIEDKVEEIFAQMPQELDDYGTVKYLYEYVIGNTEYVLDCPDNQNICSVFLRGESVCQGYAKAMQYLLQEAGIESALVLGTVGGGEGHAWNLVRMDGEWYYVDATWGDASYQVEEGSEDYAVSQMPTLNYDYLGVTTRQLQETHWIDNVVPMPDCTSLRNNYYVREGAYFTSVDTEQLTELFDGAVMEEQGFVTLKCANDEVYQEMKQYLLTQQELFSYLPSEDGVLAYYDSNSQKTIGVWVP